MTTRQVHPFPLPLDWPLPLPWFTTRLLLAAAGVVLLSALLIAAQALLQVRNR